MNSTTKTLGAIALLLAIYARLSSPDNVVITETGDIEDTTNIVRELAQGKIFWHGQLNAITTEINRLEAEPAEDAKLTQEMNRWLIEEQQAMEKTYQEHPETRPSEAARQAESLRNEADKIERAEWDRTMEKERLARIASLRKIYALIENRAR